MKLESNFEIVSAHSNIGHFNEKFKRPREKTWQILFRKLILFRFSNLWELQFNKDLF